MALGAIIYQLGQTHIIIFVSKTRPKVCPIEMLHFTIPRNELNVLSVCIRLIIFVYQTVVKYFTSVSMHFLKNSRTALTWVASKKVPKHLFNMERISNIQNKVNMNNIQMHYILNDDNPADLLKKDTGISLSRPQ